MALNLTSRLQVTAHYFWNRRNAAALSHHGVRLEYDPEQRRSAALILGIAFTLLAVALMFVLSWFKPAGQVGRSNILAERATGAIYVLVDGRLHPALNLTSARLITGQAANPTFVKAGELSKYPQGPTVGIVGAPAAMPIRTADASQWALCDTAPAATPTTSAAAKPVVTAIAGPVTIGQRSAPLRMPNAILARYRDKTYVVWEGHRSEIDLSNKAVALALGVDPDAPAPIPLSQALFDALPATEPMTSPAIPSAGEPSPWDIAPGVVIGSVLAVHGLQQPGADTLYVVLPDGVQRISPFVASLVRASNSFGGLAPVVVAPDRLAKVPVVQSLPVSYYPETRLHLVDTKVNGTTCVAWSKGATDRAAEITVLSGQGLPIPVGSEAQLVHLVKDVRGGETVEADQAFIGKAATNLVMTTSAAPAADSRESMWWISDQGVRYGIELEEDSLRALGISTANARQAPWPLIRVFAPGPALSKQAAMTQHDTLAPVTGAEALPTQSGH
ncbi:type VII secretion protein EccB [Mycobacterium branderi]|uniref:ESX-2 secretion system ATPase EccB2 n=1 Tax=Mycobacterium branderi TaxID=43348 RepID=A0A7I7WBP6_9MYCO|nr:type VII secretion protein EccB [Mycobacterium branderi]MCV7235248.1 type VII secretion protein EccB [Mycobacterium branderi]ORA29849.1 type VII secretion protein EccB [Mycobacterium branderi]BBZ15019.1 ESX-2 secretion system ATPase EccB2 [Mycobacterium branderi]